MANVFLSYDHEDLALARPIATALGKAGHAVWYDRHIHGGAQYSRKIEQALDAADAVVVLWSAHSVESAWVRDEAAEGRDRGKLVPVSLGAVTPPMGFRQFQTIELGGWKGRGKVPRLAEILEAVSSQSEEPDARRPPSPIRARPTMRFDRRWVIAALAALILAAGGWGAYKWLGTGGLPVVAVQAADAAPRSQAAATDLYVKLGSLAQIGDGKWQLIGSDGSHKADFVFRAADVGNSREPRSNLVLLDGRDNSLLWSREFVFPAGKQADLRQQMSFTAGRVLGCALESLESGRLPRDLTKLFLNACASLAEIGNTADPSQPESIARQLRTIVEARPRFVPAWSRLLNADMTLVDMAGYMGGDQPKLMAQLRSDIEAAQTADPSLPAVSLAELYFLPFTAMEQRIQLLERAAAEAPDNAEIFSAQVGAYQGVGRMFDAVSAARRAGELDPLSPAASTQVIMALAYAGQLDEARRELAKAEKLWAGTGALRDILWGFHLRYGDPRLARQLANFEAEGLDRYLSARADPTPANIARLVSLMTYREGLGHRDIGFIIQALAEFNETDELLRWLAGTPTETLAGASYILFRPAFDRFRADPRFMDVAARVGLVDFWQNTNKWPDFCRRADLPYDCKAEAAKRG